MADQIEPLPSGEDSPWARDVPIPPPPFFPAAWSRSGQEPHDARPIDVPTPPPQHRRLAETRRDTAPIVDQPVVDSAPVDRPIVDPAGGATPLTARRRSALFAGLLGVVVVAAVVAQLVGGRGSESNGAVTPDDSTDAAVADSSVPDTEAPTTTQRRPDRPSSTVATLPEPEPQWVTAPIALSPRMQAMTVPTEVIALSQDGTLHSIAIPTGVVRSLAADDGSASGGLVVGRESMVVVDYNDGSYTLARVGYPSTPIEVPGGVGLVVPRSGGDGFLVVPNQMSIDRPIPFDMTPDGTLTPIVAGPLTEVDGWAIQFLPNGQLVVSDSGGLYGFDESGSSQRLTTGDLFAVGANHSLFRECDDTRTCGYVRVDAATGERANVTLESPAGNGGFFDVGVLSPDGASLSVPYYDDTGPRLRVVDLATGAVIETEPIINSINGSPSEQIWAADSTGMFIADGNQLMFLDRATGELIPVAPQADLGSIVAVAARPLVEPAAP